jgi:HEPN domain-containing protein
LTLHSYSHEIRSICGFLEFSSRCHTISLKTGGQPWGHDITKLVILAQQNGVDVPDFICKKAKMITSWEVVSRYYPTSVIRRDTIAHVIRVADEWQKKLK